MLAEGRAAGRPVSAYHDAYDDLSGGDVLVVGPAGTEPMWDAGFTAGEGPLIIDLAESGKFSGALRAMAQAANR